MVFKYITKRGGINISHRILKLLLVAALLVCLAGSATAKTENELRDFLKADTTESMPIGPGFTALNAAELLQKNAAAAGFSCRVIEITYSDGFLYYANEFGEDSGGLTVCSRGVKGGTNGIDKLLDPVVDGQALKISSLHGTCGSEYGHKGKDGQLVPVKSHKYMGAAPQVAQEQDQDEGHEAEKPLVTADPEIHNNTFNDTRQTVENITQVINETERTVENISKVINETGQTAGKIKETVRKPVRDTVEIVQDEEKLKQVVKDRIKEKSNNISVPRERCGQVVNARAACTQIVDKARDCSSSGIGIPQGANNSSQENETIGFNSELIPPTSNNTSDKIDAAVQNFEESEDKSPGYLRQLLNWIFN